MPCRRSVGPAVTDGRERRVVGERLGGLFGPEVVALLLVILLAAILGIVLVDR